MNKIFIVKNLEMKFYILGMLNYIKEKSYIR